MKLIIIVLCCIYASRVQAITTKELMNSLVLTEKNIQEAFDGLDPTRDGVINMTDLNTLFYHKEAEYAKTKFIQMIDKKKKDLSIDMDELKQFLSNRPVINAIWECTYVHSTSLRRYCFADRILTYVVLVLDHNTIEIFYHAIEDEHDEDDVISSKEVKKLSELDMDFTEDEQELFMKKVGGGEKFISKAAFTQFVLQEGLQDKLRRCRNKLKGCIASYQQKCLVKQLMDYTMNHMTDLDIATLFIEFTQNYDFYIVKDDFTKSQICSTEVAKHFVDLMDRSGDEHVSYGEFRTYLKTHSVRLHLEKECSQKKLSQEQEITCFKKQILNLAEENYTPVWLALPSLDMLFLFDELDVTDNGFITQNEDLVLGKEWSEKLAKKMIGEIDGRDKDGKVCLKEFYEYIGEPHMVYGLADCAALMRSQDRIDCYVIELQDIVEYMLDKPKVEAFFDYYDKDDNKKITIEDLKKVGISGETANNFLLELGMGDDTVTYREFFWFVRQQELSRMFAKCYNKDQLPSDLNAILLDYLANKMTEYDTQLLFKALDTDSNWELKCSDFGPENAAIVREHLKKMDFHDKDDIVNFFEFWLILNTPIGNPRKEQLETACTRPKLTQKEKMVCYIKEIVNIK